MLDELSGEVRGPFIVSLRVTDRRDYGRPLIYVKTTTGVFSKSTFREA
jgi:hypothetical protein